MSLEPSIAYPSMDPLLQWHQEQELIDLTQESIGPEIAVIARVSDLAAFLALAPKGVRLGAHLGTDPLLGGEIVTARIPLKKVVEIRQSPCVQSLKAAEPLRPCLADTIKDLGARKDLLPSFVKGQQGKGVVVGIVDYDCDFAHQNFRTPTGESRILTLFAQGAAASPLGRPGPFGYGQVFTKEDLNQALKSHSPYAALGYTPRSQSHGTHVMDIAAGNGLGSGVPGVAPKTDLVFVHLATTDLPFDSPEVVGKNLGDSVRLLEAIKFIFEQAGDRPCVINCSLGTNGGPHDGTSLVERGIDAMLAAKPNRCVVIAAGNSFEDQIHESGVVTKTKPVSLLWKTRPQDRTANEVEIWYEGNEELELEVIQPSGASLGRVPLGQSKRWRTADGVVALLVAHRKLDPNNKDNTIGVFLGHRAPSGTWTLRLHGVKTPTGKFHAWVERDDFGPSNFESHDEQGLDESYTLGSISTGFHTVVVGSYNAHKSALPLSVFSSSGPTRDGRHKPEISAPGEHVAAAASLSGNGTLDLSGTSMAAPAVTGVVALALAEAKAHNISLASTDILEILRIGARTTGVPWDKRLGAGRIDARAVLQAVRKRVL